jgi:hypothetical protein
MYMYMYMYYQWELLSVFYQHGHLRHLHCRVDNGVGTQLEISTGGNLFSNIFNQRNGNEKVLW